MVYRTPEWEKAGLAFQEFCQTVAKLRHPEGGCPWDLKQDHLSLRRFMVEEAYEAFDAMTSGNFNALCDELGDVLLQVVLNAQVAIENGAFEIADVITSINSKMKRRHPHVFYGTQVKSEGEVRANWEQIKASEVKYHPKHGYFAEVVSKNPSTSQAAKIGKLAAKINFDWGKVEDVLAQVKSEVEEVEEEFKAPELSIAKIREEIGDVYFSLAQLCRHLDLDPEEAALDGNQKFLRRFSALEKLAEKAGINIEEAKQSELEGLWLEAKRLEKK